MNKNMESLEKFKKYLLNEKNNLCNQIKSSKGNRANGSSGHDVNENASKSLMFKKHQINYFISLIDNGISAESDGFFISFKALSNMLVFSGLTDQEKIDILAYFFIINKDLIELKDSIPSVFSVYDNYSVLINLPFGRISALGNQVELLKELKNPNCKKSLTYYENLCNKSNTLNKYIFQCIINSFENDFVSMNYFDIVSFIESLEFMNINKEFLNFLREKLLHDYYSQIKDKDTLLFFEDNIVWFKQVCMEKNLESIYITMINIAQNIVSHRDFESYVYVCALDGYINYVIQLNTAEHLKQPIPNTVLKYQKNLK